VRRWRGFPRKNIEIKNRRTQERNKEPKGWEMPRV
jgi:hypothetical protein